MKLLFITLFPALIEDNFSYSILKRAREAGIIEVSTINPRDFTLDRHHTVDDAPFGGGAGMVLKAQPFIAAIQAAKALLPAALVIMLCPGGRQFSQTIAESYTENTELIFVCGHYEGFDERIKLFVDQSVSIGDYILTGGELAALVLSDAICRLLPGVLGKIESTELESFSSQLLEHPQYTRPAKAEFGDVPEVLLSGDHAKIARWRRKEMLQKTFCQRPDLLRAASLQPEDGQLLLEIINEKIDGEND